MKHRFALLLVALTVGLLGSRGRVHAERLLRPDAEIIVDGRSQQRFAHNGRLYVEALKGREYAIRLHNPYPVRVAVALSVDGLNTIDARESTAQAARKWVLDPYATVTISGWQTSQAEARRFEFTTEARSYGQALGKTANLGVVTAVFFKERVVIYEPEVSNESRLRKLPPATAAAPEASAAERDSASPSEGARADKAAQASGARQRTEEFAATGMGRST